MKTNLLFPSLALALGLGLPFSYAQSQAGAVNARTTAAEEQALSDARALAAVADFDGAEHVLEMDARGARGSALRNQVVAFSLMEMAADFRARGDSVASTAFARRALQRVLVAKKLAGAEPGRTANLMEMAGFISERYFGDIASAKVYYTEAEKLAPGAGQSAEALARIAAGEAAAERKTQRAGKS